MQRDAFPADQAVSNLLAFDRWLKDIDRTPATGWRWRKKGWIKTVNVCGRLYITRGEISRFETRAAAGEFSKAHVTPKRQETAQIGTGSQKAKAGSMG